MKIVNKKMSLAEFKEYLDKKDFGQIPPDRLVIHHTYSPKEEDGDGVIEAGEWNGQKSIDALKKYYEGKGWSAGPHLFIADDGIWLFTDMYDVGIHAGAGNASWKNKKTGMIWKGWGDDFTNQELLDYSIGIEVVGDYDNKLWDEETLTNSVGAIKLLLKRLNIPDEMIFFHRDFSNKSCPGRAITKEWLIGQLNDQSTESKYLDNYTKIFTAVERLLGEEYGENPNDNETKEILEKLEKLKKEKDNLYDRYSEEVARGNRLEGQLKEFKNKAIAFINEL